MLNIRVLALGTLLLSAAVLPARLSAQRTIPAGVTPATVEMTPEQIAERSRQRQGRSMRSRPWAGWVAVGAFTGGVIGLVYGVRTGMKSEYPVLALPLLVPIGAGSGAVLGGIGGAVAYQLYRVVRRPDGAVVEER